jgi:prophage regulatory protein
MADEQFDLVGVAEVSTMLNITPQRVHQLDAAGRGFPEPVAVLAAGRIWRRRDIEAWARETGRMQ